MIAFIRSGLLTVAGLVEPEVALASLLAVVLSGAGAGLGAGVGFAGCSQTVIRCAGGGFSTGAGVE